MISGLDVASFQHPPTDAHPHGAPIDFAKVAASGRKFVYIKATEGVGYVNPFFVQDVHAAHQAGLKVGAYLFFRPSVDPVGQANKFHEVIHVNGVHLDLPVAIDAESTDNLPHHEVHDRIDTVRTVLRQHGYRTMTYSYEPFLLQNVAHDCKFCASDPLWLAAYQGKAPTAPAPWGRVTVWQNYDKATIPGVPSAAEDSDIFEGDAEHFAVFAGRKPTAPKQLPAWYHRLLEFPVSALRAPGHTVVVDGVRYQQGDDVKAVQRKVGVKADGLFGARTASHVKGFQTMHHLRADGIVGPDTAKALG